MQAAQLCPAWKRSEMTETCEEKVQKNSVYFVHNFNKLRQVKLSAVWTLSISTSLTILIYDRY